MNETEPNNLDNQESQKTVENNEYSPECLDLLEAINSGEGKVNAQRLEDDLKEGLISETEFGKLAFELLKKIEIQAEKAVTDELTGLNNLMGFNEKWNKIVKELRFTSENRRENPLQKIVLFAFDVNFLKPLNDIYGHEAGDKGLIALANRLKESVKEEKDVVARIGGDEFLILMPIDSTKEDIPEKIFARLQEALSNLTINIENQDDPYQISTASGFAILDKSDTETTAKELRKKADLNMYEHKQEMKKAL